MLGTTTCSPVRRCAAPLLLTLLICLVLLPASLASAAIPPHHDMIAVDDASGDGRDGLRSGGYDVVGPGLREQTVLIADADDQARLIAAGYRFSILQVDLEARDAARRGKGVGFGDFHTYSETEERLDELHALYPTLTTAKYSIGTTSEGRTLWALKVSDNPDAAESEPQVMFNGTHHAREPMSNEACLMLIEYLCANYESDPRIHRLVDEREIYFVPIINPDGYVFNETNYPNGGGYWRKNRRDNGDGSFGVDLNRNYTYQWGLAGSSEDPSYDDYRGPSAGSEPEVQAMMAFSIAHQFQVVQDFHTFRGMTLFPWGYTTDDSPDDAAFRDIGAQMTAQNGYGPGQTSETLYYTSGGAEDWQYGEQTIKGKTFAFSNEIGWGVDGFWPLDSRIPQLFRENLEPALHLIEIAGPSVQVRSHSISGGNGNARLDPGESAALSLVLQSGGVMMGLADLQVTVLCNDPFVTVSDAQRLPGTLAARSTWSTGASPIPLNVGTDCPVGRVIDLTLHCTWSGGTQDLSLSLPVGEPEIVFADGFESGTGLWTLTTPWGVTTSSVHRGTQALADSPAGTYADSTDTYAEIAASLDLSTIQSPYLSFWTRYDIEQFWDYGIVEASTDGEQWTGIQNLSGTDNTWKLLTVSLAEYAGQSSVRIRFHILSDTWGQSDGWYLDDVTVSGPGPVDSSRILNPANGHYYEVVNTSINWEAAKVEAESLVYNGLSGHLVTITSAAENLFLTNTFGSTGLHYRWMGGFQPVGSPEPAGGWKWVTCEPFVYTNGSFANNTNGTEDRIVFDHGVVTDGKQWNDLTGTWNASGFVVEYESDALPDAQISPLALNFGDVFLGANSVLTAGVANAGCGLLQVTSLSFDNPVFTAGLAVPFNVTGGATQTLNVTFAPVVPGSATGVMTLTTNDAAHPTLTVALSGTGQYPPNIVVTPSEISAALPPDSTGNASIHVENTGAGPLNFTVPSPDLYSKMTVVANAAAPAIEREKGAPDTEFGPTPLGSGGPDLYGYRWTDSDAVGGPTFSWIDVSETGTVAMTSGDDSNLGPFPIGFEFKYYGNLYTNFRVCSNGFISFTSTSTAYTNASIPSASAPLNMIAPFWDNMNLNAVGSGDIWYQNVGGKLVVQWDGVMRYGTTTPVSFEIILSPSGTIIFQYQTLTGAVTSSATIGIQDATGAAGLRVAYNAAYLHNNMAIKISAVPQWLTVTPASGTIPAGGSADLAVGFDTANLCGEHFLADVHVLNNDADSPDVVVPVTMNLLGMPDVQVSPSNLAFGNVYLTTSAVLAASVANVGCAVLHVLDVSIDNPVFTTDLVAPFDVALGAAHAFNTTFTPSVADQVTGIMTLTTNDPAQPTLSVVLSGTGLNPPDIVVSPTSISAVMPPNGADSADIHIENTGAGPLTYTIPAPGFADKRLYPDGAFESDAPVIDPGLTQLGSGGPDAYGYRWTDSDAVDGPTFSWIDVSDTGTAAMTYGDNANSGPFPIGFTFSYYGNQYTGFRVCSNGFISFTSTATTATNASIPSTSAPLNMIAPFWDDLNLDAAGSGDIWYQNLGGNLVVQWDGVKTYTGAVPLTFEMILTPSGTIRFQYLTLGTAGTSATVGIQNATGAAGLRVVYNAAFLHNNLAIQFSALPAWAAVTPTSGTIPSGGGADVTVAFDTSGLCGDQYSASVHVLSNDLDSPDVSVPVTLEVTEAPDAQYSPSSLTFGDVYLTTTALRTTGVANVGCATLHVTGVSIDHPAFMADVTAPFDVGVGAIRAINVTFAPTTAGPATGVLTLSTDDVAHPTLTVTLAGVGLNPAGIVVTPNELTQIVPTNGTGTAGIHIENVGAGPLNFTIPSPDLYSKMAVVANAAAPAIEREKGSPDIEFGPTPLGSGGPDLYGYRWIDSDAVGGPTFSWIDVSETGTVAMTSGIDSNLGPFPIGFEFKYYGNLYTSFRVCSNGFISFTSTSTTYTNASIPSASAPLNMIAPFWDDMNLDVVGSGDIWYQNVGGNLVVQWDGVTRYGTTTPVNFEIILSPSGTIIFQYQTLTGAVTNSATIGIQNATGAAGLQVAYNAVYLHNNMAIKISAVPQWATVFPISGTIPAGGSSDLTVTFESAGLASGLHTGSLQILSNDLMTPVVLVPLTMNVQEYISGVEELPGVLELSQNVPNPFNPSTLISFAMPMKGPADLRIFDVRGALVRTLVTGDLEAGYHNYLWEGRSDAGVQVSSGVYFCRLRTAEGDLIRSMTLVK